MENNVIHIKFREEIMTIPEDSWIVKEGGLVTLHALCMPAMETSMEEAKYWPMKKKIAPWVEVSRIGGVVTYARPNEE